MPGDVDEDADGPREAASSGYAVCSSIKEQSTMGKRIDSKLKSEMQLESIVHTMSEGEMSAVKTPQLQSQLVGTRFNTVMLIMTLLNTLLLGLQVDYPERNVTWEIAEHIFTGVFATEMLIKLGVFRSQYFADKINCLDGSLAVLGVVDALFSSFFALEDASTFMSALRILRLFRVSRMLRLLHMVKPFVLVLEGVSKALLASVYIFAVCIFIFYGFSVVLTEQLGKSNSEYYPAFSRDIETIDDQSFLSDYNPHVYFGSMASSMLTLFNMATFTEWAEVVRPIAIKQPWYLLIFLLFALTVSFGVMNVLIGVIVEVVSAQSQRIQTEYDQQYKKGKWKTMGKIQQMLDELDTDGNGVFHLEELHEVLKDHTVLKDLIKKIDLPRGWSTSELLDMLDNSGCGVLSHAQFATNLFRLLDSDSFQQACIMQASVNHAKALIMDQNKHFGNVLSTMQSDIADIKAALQITSSVQSHSEDDNEAIPTAREILGQSAEQYLKSRTSILTENEGLVSRMQRVVEECIHKEFDAFKPSLLSDVECSRPESKWLGPETSYPCPSKVATAKCLHPIDCSRSGQCPPLRFANPIKDIQAIAKSDTWAEDLESTHSDGRVSSFSSSSNKTIGMPSSRVGPNGLRGAREHTL